MIDKVLVSISNVDLEIDKGIWSGCFTVSTGSLDLFRVTRMLAECFFPPTAVRAILHVFPHIPPFPTPSKRSMARRTNLCRPVLSFFVLHCFGNLIQVQGAAVTMSNLKA